MAVVTTTLVVEFSGGEDEDIGMEGRGKLVGIFPDPTTTPVHAFWPLLRKGGVADELIGMPGLMFWVFDTTDRIWFVNGGVAFAGKLGGGMEVVLVTDIVTFPDVLATTCCRIKFLFWLEVVLS